MGCCSKRNDCRLYIHFIWDDVLIDDDHDDEKYLRFWLDQTFAP